jgi:hypothetical protein
MNRFLLIKEVLNKLSIAMKICCSSELLRADVRKSLVGLASLLQIVSFNVNVCTIYFLLLLLVGWD